VHQLPLWLSDPTEKAWARELCVPPLRNEVRRVVKSFVDWKLGNLTDSEFMRECETIQAALLDVHGR